MSDNPYSPPSSSWENPVTSNVAGDILAERSTRFVSALVDGILMSGILLPIQFITGYYARLSNQEASVFERLGMSFLGLGIMFALQGYLLIDRGQTIGKLLTKIQIVDFRSGERLPFLRVFVFRYLWLWPFAILVSIIPGPVDDMMFSFASLVDPLMIFGASRRCLHDYIAGSKVVLFLPDRPRARS